MSKNHPPILGLLNMGQLLEQEKAHMLNRRKLVGKSEDLENDSLGIALSGGGIRSATTCLGIMKELNQKGLIQNADYLSSVSGGGYIAAYIHAALKAKLSKKKDTVGTKEVYKALFSESDMKHLMKYREYLYVLRARGIQRIISKAILFFVALLGTIANSLWIIMPFFYRWLVSFFQTMPDTDGWVHFVIMIGISLFFGFTMSPNVTSPHFYYKWRLKKAYLKYGKKLKLWQLDRADAPYPLINANVSVNYDKYDTLNHISYRGPINSNYFLFSPLYCGSQVTNYAPSKNNTYSNMTLATAMATSAAAVNTFMGNFKLPVLIRQIMALLNLRTGILAPNPQLKNKVMAFWPHYTFLEVLGNSDTTTHYIQVSDGGHIENLGIYELLRRKVKVIIAIDAGEDKDFSFEDLRNLVVRARSEQGIIINFHPNAKPQDVIKPDITSGFSNRYFVVARIKGMEGAYQEDYNGILIYIKSAKLARLKFEMRKIKKDVKQFVEKGETDNVIEAKRRLNSHSYRTYNPKFPHQPTADQFFDETQWNAYHDLGQEIGKKVCELLAIEDGDTGSVIFEKAQAHFESYNWEYSG